MLERKRSEIIASAIGILLLGIPMISHLFEPRNLILYLGVVLVAVCTFAFVLNKIKFIYESKFSLFGTCLFVFALLFFKNAAEINPIFIFLLIAFLIANIIVIVRAKDESFE